MKQTIQLFMFILCVCFFSIEINAQTNSTASETGDARVEKALRETKTEYTVNKDGEYKVTFATDGKRSQVAYINAETDKIYGLEMRGIFSYAMVSDKPPSPEIANLLLEQNMVNISSWAILKPEKGGKGKYIVVNIIYIPADADGKTLDAALNSVILAADEMEKRLTEKDEF
ncbi:MAG: hypothetical protein ACR2GD_09530 [Pyrinomonadaceae bacterium]